MKKLLSLLMTIIMLLSLGTNLVHSETLPNNTPSGNSSKEKPIMRGNDYLLPGQFLSSKNKVFIFQFSNSGKEIKILKGNSTIWSKSFPTKGTKLKLLSDGRLALLNNNIINWSTDKKITTQTPVMLILRDDGVIQIAAAGVKGILWSTSNQSSSTVANKPIKPSTSTTSSSTTSSSTTSSSTTSSSTTSSSTTSSSGTNRNKQDFMNVNDYLNKQQYLESSNGIYQLWLQGSDSNLVFREKSGKVLWSAKTANSGGDKLTLSSDGNLKLLKGSTTIWSSNKPSTNSNISLKLDNDGNLKIVNKSTGQITWKISKNDIPSTSNNVSNTSGNNTGTNNGNSGSNSSVSGKVDTQSGVIKTSGNITVNTSAQDGMYQVVVIGASTYSSNQQDDQNKVLASQGFKKISYFDPNGGDRTIGMWVRKKTNGQNSSVNIKGNNDAGKDLAYAVLTIKDTSYNLDNPKHNTSDSHTNSYSGNNCKTSLPSISGSNFKIIGIFFDDPCSVTDVNGGKLLASHKSFGDGDGFSVILYDNNQSPAGSVSCNDNDGSKQGNQVVSMIITP